MEPVLTVGILLGGLGLAAAMAWLERRPKTELNPRLVPTTALMFLGLLVVILAAAHLLTITGITTR
jgi:hypothetical protein